MPPDNSDDPITRLFQACDPNEALEPGDPRYVNLDDARGGIAIKSMIRAVRRSGKPERLLFAGHMGIGKSSELKRLQAELQKPTDNSKPHCVVWVDTTKQLDANDLDLPDLLVLIAAELQRQLAAAEIPGFTPLSTYMKRLWKDLLGLLGSHVHLKEVEADTGFASLTLELRNRPTARSVLRDKIESLATDLIGAVNKLLDEANAALRANGRAGVVLLVDGLEKMSLRTLDGGITTHERLFIHRSSQMAGIAAHTIYTVPISLYYSPNCAVLEQAFGEFNSPVTMVRIRGDDKSPVTGDTLGMQRLWELLDLRCKFANVEFDDAFTSAEVWQYLCEMSGGHPRHLLMFVRTACNELDSLPVTLEAAEHAIRTYANSLLREVPDGFWEPLKQFVEPQDDMPRDSTHQQMLYLLHVFEYLNGRPWYEVNPVLRTLDRLTGD